MSALKNALLCLAILYGIYIIGSTSYQFFIGSTKMDSIEAFETEARNCKIDKVRTYKNFWMHRVAPDSQYHINVHTTDGDGKELHYSYTQKDALKNIFDDASKKCVQYTTKDKYNSYIWDTNTVGAYTS